MIKTAVAAKQVTRTSTEIYLAKRSKIIWNSDGGNSSLETVGTVAKNLEALGYTLSGELFRVLVNSSVAHVEKFYETVVPILKRLRGAHKKFAPMYPNFPQQVMDASDFELYFNAMLHYWGDWIGVRILPEYQKEKREPLTELVNLKVILLGSEDDFHSIFTQLVGVNSSLSAEDKEIVHSFVVNTTAQKIQSLLPESIPQKETLAMLAGWLGMPSWFTGYLKTATDILRVAVILSKGDVSLAKPTKFINFNRRTRRFLLAALDKCPNSIEDMLRWRERWIRLGEIIHPGYFKAQYPKAYTAFHIVRNNLSFQTFNSKVEAAIKDRQIKEAVALVIDRPGVFARRLDHLLRLANTEEASLVSRSFLKVAPQAATPLLLQLYQHFKNRVTSNRAFFPKGNVAKIQVDTNTLPPLNKVLTDSISKGIADVLIKRFSSLESLGNVYIDPQLQTQLIPIGQRSAAKALRTISRGSRISLPKGEIVRFFLWWKDGESRTDIDLSLSVLGENFERASDIAYYSLREYGCYHSGDITSAPHGACEFIDLDIKKARRYMGRYAMMCLNSYTQQPFCDLPECFAGWMLRKEVQSGEIFEPKTVQDKIDLAANTTVAVPVIIDLEENTAIWTDLALTSRNFINNVRTNKSRLSQMAQAIVNLNRANLYDLFYFHTAARGKLVDNMEQADTVFSMHNGITPFDSDKILSEFLQ